MFLQNVYCATDDVTKSIAGLMVQRTFRRLVGIGNAFSFKKRLHEYFNLSIVSIVGDEFLYKDCTFDVLLNLQYASDTFGKTLENYKFKISRK